MQNRHNIYIKYEHIALDFTNPGHIALYPFINFEVFSSVFNSNGYKGEGDHYDFDEISFESDKTTYDILTTDINIVLFTGASKKLDNPLEIGRVTIPLLNFMAGPPRFQIPLEDDYNIENIVLSFDCASDSNNELELEFSELSCYCVAKYEDYTLKLSSTQVDSATPEVVCSVNEDRDKLYWLDLPPISSYYTHDSYFSEKIKIEIFTKAGGFTNKNPFGRGTIELLPILLDIRNYGKVTSTARIVFNDGTGKSTEFNFTLKVKNPVLFQQLYDGYYNGYDVVDSTETLPLYVIPIPPHPDVRIIFDNTPEKVTLVDSVYDIYKQRKNFWLEKEDSVGKYYTNIIDNKNYRIRGSSHFFKVTYCGYRPLGLKLSCKTGICVVEDTVPDSIADVLGCFIPQQVVLSVNDNDTTGLTIEKVTELVKQYYTQLELLIFDPYCIPAYTLLYPEGYSIGSLSNLKQKVDEGFILTGNTYKRDVSQMENNESTTETKVFIYRCPECNGYGQLNEKAEEIVCPSCEETFAWNDDYILSDEEVKKLFGQSPTDNNEEENNNNNNNSDNEEKPKGNASDSDDEKPKPKQQDSDEEDNDKPKQQSDDEKPVSVEEVQLKEDNNSNNNINENEEKHKKHKKHHKKDKGEKTEETVEEEKPKEKEEDEKPKEEPSNNNNNENEEQPKKHKKHHKKDKGEKVDEKPKEEEKPKEKEEEETVQLPSSGKVKVKCPDCGEIIVFDEKPDYLDCNCGTSVEVQDSMIV